MRNVVCDIGGVLLDWNPRHLYRHLIADPGEMERFLAEVCTMDWNLTLDAGRPFDEACAELAATHPEQAELIHAWKRQDEMIGGEIPGIAALVERLVAHEVPRYLLTNMPAAVYRARWERWAVLREFQGAVVSGEEGVTKPSAEIFAVVTERFELDPAETLFIDDSLPNVEAARAAGFEAHHFRTAAALGDLFDLLGW